MEQIFPKNLFLDHFFEMTEKNNSGFLKNLNIFLEGFFYWSLIFHISLDLNLGQAAKDFDTTHPQSNSKSFYFDILHLKSKTSLNKSIIPNK